MVEITSNTKTIELTGEEVHVRFTEGFPYFWLRNDGSGAVLMSLYSNIEEGKDGVIKVLAGGSAGTMHGFNDTRNDFYISGSGSVQVIATHTPENPFRKAQKGGGDFDVIVGTKYEGTNVMPQTLAKIDEYTIGSDVIKLIAENWGMPFEDDADNDNAGRIWLDKGKNIFLLCEAVKDSRYTWFNISIKLCHGSVVSGELFTYAGINNPPGATYLYMDCNPNGTALYIRTWYSTMSYALVIAKDKSGDWSCFTTTKMITQNGVFNINATNAIYDANLLYSAFTVPNPVNGSLFDGLYLMHTSPAYASSGSGYAVTFSVNDKPFRGFTVQNGVSITTGKPNYAFEARQTKEV